MSTRPIRLSIRAVPECEPAQYPAFGPAQGAPDHDPDEPPGQIRLWSSLHPAAGPQLHLDPPGADRAGGADADRRHPTLSPRSLRLLLVSVLEVLDGRRQVGQLRTVLSAPAYEALLTRLRIMPAGNRHQLLRLRTCEPAHGAVEVAAAIGITSRFRAGERVICAAARLEHRDGTWRCVVLRIL